MRLQLSGTGRSVLRRIGIALLAAGLVLPVPATAADGIIGAAEASPRVFDGGSDGVRDGATITVELARPARVSVVVVDAIGRVVRTLQSGAWRDAGVLSHGWSGRSASGVLLDDAGFRVRIDASDGVTSERRELPITKARSAIYPANPGAIVVAIDPGHGGPDPGAVRSPIREKNVNLDIALRLRAMLEGAGVTVVMTRTTDSVVNVGRVDWNADGAVDYRDELASRPHIANLARAAVLVSVHNNSARSTRPRGTATYFWQWRSYATENRLLAGTVHAGIMASLRGLRRSGWRAVDHGLRSYPFYVLNDVGLTRARPSLMPAILSEALYVSNRADRAALASEAGRGRIAAGMYEGLAAYFGRRAFGAVYALEAGPGEALVEGAEGSLRVRVTNTSPGPWLAGAMSLALSSLPRVPYYDGSGATGTPLATVPLPALDPGASAVIAVPFIAPSFAGLAATGGRGLLFADLVAGTDRLSGHGVVALQLPYAVLEAPALDPLTAEPPPDPTPTPTPDPTPTPTPDPTPTPTPDPTLMPTPAIEPTPFPDPTPGPTSDPTPAP